MARFAGVIETTVGFYFWHHFVLAAQCVLLVCARGRLVFVAAMFAMHRTRSNVICIHFYLYCVSLSLKPSAYRHR